MKQLKTDITGKFPFVLDDLRWQFEGLKEAIAQIAKGFGNLVILWGLEESAAGLSPGAVFIENEIYMFDGWSGTLPQFYYLNKTTSFDTSGLKEFPDRAEGDRMKNTYEINKIVLTTDNSGYSIHWFTRIADINNLKQTVASNTTRSNDNLLKLAEMFKGLGDSVILWGLEVDNNNSITEGMLYHEGVLYSFSGNTNLESFSSLTALILDDQDIPFIYNAISYITREDVPAGSIILQDLPRISNFVGMQARLATVEQNLKSKIIDIGAWDMTASSSMQVQLDANEIPFESVKAWEVYIYPDGTTNPMKLNSVMSNYIRSGYSTYASGLGQFTLFRNSQSTLCTGPYYTSNSQSRGHIVVWYE